MESLCRDYFEDYLMDQVWSVGDWLAPSSLPEMWDDGLTLEAAVANLKEIAEADGIVLHDADDLERVLLDAAKEVYDRDEDTSGLTTEQVAALVAAGHIREEGV